MNESFEYRGKSEDNNRQAKPPRREFYLPEHLLEIIRIEMERAARKRNRDYRNPDNEQV